MEKKKKSSVEIQGHLSTNSKEDRYCQKSAICCLVRVPFFPEGNPHWYCSPPTFSIQSSCTYGASLLQLSGPWALPQPCPLLLLVCLITDFNSVLFTYPEVYMLQTGGRYVCTPIKGLWSRTRWQV